MYCQNCGKEIDENATICMQCGVLVNSADTYSESMVSTSPKSKWLSLILAILLGWLGIHRFYAGKIFTGILWLLTFGVFGIGWLIDVIIILCGEFHDSNGLPIDN